MLPDHDLADVSLAINLSIGGPETIPRSISKSLMLGLFTLFESASLCGTRFR